MSDTKLKHPYQWRFWYFGEVFILLHLCGFTHASWWWAALFYFIDFNEGLGQLVAQRWLIAKGRSL